MSDFENDLINLIFIIKKSNKPALYLGSYSITKFKAFIDGFAFGYSFPNVHQFFPDFQKYIEKKYAHNGTVKGWNTLLLEQVNDEKKALDIFFIEFELFMNENNIDIPSDLPKLHAL